MLVLFELCPIQYELSKWNESEGKGHRETAVADRVIKGSENWSWPHTTLK